MDEQRHAGSDSRDKHLLCQLYVYGYLSAHWEPIARRLIRILTFLSSLHGAQGHIFVQKRVAFKETFPSHYDPAPGGVVGAQVPREQCCGFCERCATVMLAYTWQIHGITASGLYFAAQGRTSHMRTMR